MNLNIPYLETDNKLLNDAYRIAAGDIVGNIVYYQNGLLTEEKPCMIAGLDYNTPWTEGYGNQHLERVEHFVSGGFQKHAACGFGGRRGKHLYRRPVLGFDHLDDRCQGVLQIS